MSDPAYMFMERVGEWHDKYAYLPVRLYDGHWIWRQPYRSALYQTKMHLDGPSSSQRVNALLIANEPSKADFDIEENIRNLRELYSSAMEDKRLYRDLSLVAEKELRERRDQVDKLQQEQDEINVALAGVVRDQINTHQHRLEAIQVLKRRAEQ
ncbi:MAG: hypothetical protein NXH70_02075 [Hyphomonas sp.]|nr:hypothetical protein [Hyphomonas sp.]